jgi:hypothetical protein
MHGQVELVGAVASPLAGTAVAAVAAPGGAARCGAARGVAVDAHAATATMATSAEAGLELTAPVMLHHFHRAAVSQARIRVLSSQTLRHEQRACLPSALASRAGALIDCRRLAISAG